MNRPFSIYRLFVYIWASPTTVVGILVGSLTMMSKGRAQIRRGAIEFYGGFSSWFLERVAKAAAMTLGHVIIGRNLDCLERYRDHEQVHVRQVERWGPLFIPLYLLASGLAWAKGQHFYFDNVFEIDARRRSSDRSEPENPPEDEPLVPVS